MEYSLSSSLVGGSGSINPDALSLDLQFAADKTLTARKGPTPVLTRASTATYLAPQLSIDGYLLDSIYNSTNAGYPSFTVSYNGTQWQIAKDNDPESQNIYYAAAGNELTPDKADWSASGSSPVIKTSSSIVYSAAINAARFDHEPLTASSKGLLIEESRTNRTAYSTKFSNSYSGYWNSTANNIAANDSVATSPSGTGLSSSSITEIAGVMLTRHIHETTGAFTPAANTAYTMSAWVKQPPSDPVRYVQLAFWIAGFGSTAYMNYDIQSGTVGTGGAGITASSITAYPNGWYRITATATSVASPAASGFQLGFSTSSSAGRTEAYTVVSPLKSIYLWGAQVEQGAFATSYIPTTTTSLTRSADVCSITGSNFTEMWNRFAGTGIASISSMYSNSGRFVANNIGARALEVYKSNGNTLFFEVSGAQERQISNSSTIPFKAGVAYAIDDYQGSFNGTLGGVDTNTGGTIPNATSLSIGNLNNGNFLNGTISSIRYYKKRLPNAKLQTLTT